MGQVDGLNNLLREGIFPSRETLADLGVLPISFLRDRARPFLAPEGFFRPMQPDSCSGLTVSGHVDAPTLAHLDDER
ncbi:MAG: hypothetical protein CM1200mP9_09260 [Gammaproteobacteria bacterium]|nr:MAG: hypothetical protein CM1200mP9_09260 [Gammaproteobacteria bacterium]